MPIESNLKRIADSLEIIAGVMDDKAVKSFAATVPLPDHVGAPTPVEGTPVPTPAPIVDTPTVAPPIADAPTSVSAPAPAPEVGTASVTVTEVATQMTLEQLNTELVVQYNRLNKDRTLIDATIKGFGVNTATELAPADYQVVLDKVRAL